LTSRRASRWILIGFAAVVVLAAAFSSLFWRRYLLSALRAPPDSVLSFYEPRERIAGIEDGPPLQRVTPQEEKMEPAALQAAADYAESIGSRALIVSRHGHVVFERYWHGSAFDTVVDTGAFNTVISSIMIGIAQGERKLPSIDVPAADYLTEWRGDARSRIRIIDLLQMSSGLAVTSQPGPAWLSRTRARFSSDILAQYRRRPLAGRPGIDWAYQSADPQWLGVIVERAAHTRYATYMSERLWKRLGAADAELWLDRPGGAPHLDCCLLARQGDWIRVAEMLLNDGVYQGERILPPGWAQRMLTPAAGNEHYGFHVWLGSADAAAQAYTAPDVDLLRGPGKTRLWIVPSLALAILRTGGEPPAAAHWQDALIPNLIVGGVRDFVRPVAPRRAVDISRLVPNH
jgi:CubicO group peptidase (beta-lactamase class C family)